MLGLVGMGASAWCGQSVTAAYTCAHRHGFLISLSSVGDELTLPGLSVLDPKDLHSSAALLLTLAVPCFSFSDLVSSCLI